jgi:hypothetical protein
MCYKLVHIDDLELANEQHKWVRQERMHDIMVTRAQEEMERHKKDKKTEKVRALAEQQVSSKGKGKGKDAKKKKGKPQSSASPKKRKTNAHRRQTMHKRTEPQNPLSLQIDLRFQRFMRRSSQWPALYFHNTVMAAIVGSTIVMALPYHGMSLEYAHGLIIAGGVLIDILRYIRIAR